MGSPKALLRVGEMTFLERILMAYSGTTVPRYIVLGGHASEIQAETDLSQTQVLINPNPSQGPLSSLLIGLAETSATADAIILHPVDHPCVTKKTVCTLLEEHARLPGCILIPEFQGRRGHPILIPSRFYPDLRRAPLAEGTRWMVRSNRASNHLVPVNDPAILLNIDTVEQYRQLTGYPALHR